MRLSRSMYAHANDLRDRTSRAEVVDASTSSELSLPDCAIIDGGKIMIDTAATLSVKNLTKSFIGQHGIVNALRDVSFEIEQGQSLSIVGESGCGKTTAALCIAGLQSLDAGSVTLSGKNFSAASRAEQNQLRSESMHF